MLTTTEKGELIENIDEEIINFEYAFQDYLKSGKSSTSLECYTPHSSKFDNLYKMNHFV